MLSGDTLGAQSGCHEKADLSCMTRGSGTKHEEGVRSTGHDLIQASVQLLETVGLGWWVGAIQNAAACCACSIYAVVEVVVCIECDACM